MNKELEKDIFQWDIGTWSRVIPVWEKVIFKKGYKTGLEIGANQGGGSLFLALNEINVICSDIVDPQLKAENLHSKYNVCGRIEYKIIDGKSIPFSDNSFDIVIFKSVIGYLNNYEERLKMILEINRVLKPGGVLIFAENLKGSYIHQIARRLFIPWGSNWTYLSLSELHVLFSEYSYFQIQTTGFFAAFARNNKYMYRLFSYFDSIFKFIPSKMKYVAFGYSIK